LAGGSWCWAVIGRGVSVLSSDWPVLTGAGAAGGEVYLLYWRRGRAGGRAAGCL